MQSTQLQVELQYTMLEKSRWEDMSKVYKFFKKLERDEMPRDHYSHFLKMTK